MFYSTLRPLIALALTLGLSVTTTTEAQGQMRAGINVRLHLLDRTYPGLFVPARTQAVGQLLYPGYMDLGGQLHLDGTPEFLKQASDRLEGAVGDPEDIARELMVRILKLSPERKWEYMPALAAGMSLKAEGDVDEPGPIAYWTFRIPVAMGGEWIEGQYMLEMGIRYLDGGALKTAGIQPIPFQVKDMVEGSGDEINLLTNAWLDTEGMLALRLVEQGRYTRMQLYERVLELDPLDVWARHELAQQCYGYFLDQRRPLKLYEEVVDLIDTGKAHRLEGLLEPQQQLRSVRQPRDAKEWKQVVARHLAMAKDVADRDAAAKARVERIARHEGPKSLIDLVRTGKAQNLWSRDDVYPSVWAIRKLGDLRTDAARRVLRDELEKLPPIPGAFQRELVNALASIEGAGPKVSYDAAMTRKGTEAIEWWRAQPTPPVAEVSAASQPEVVGVKPTEPRSGWFYTAGLAASALAVVIVGLGWWIRRGRRAREFRGHHT